MNNDLISREALRNVILNDRKLDGANANWEVNRILVHIDNAPTVEPRIEYGTDGQPYKLSISNGKEFERPQGDCEKCDFRKFTETFVDGVVDVMNRNGITSVEQLSEILKGGTE